MAIVDSQGRLLGRWNLIDAVVLVLILGAVPVAYGGYLLFRTPVPVLTAVEPAVLTAGPNLRVKVIGENLRPYLRVSFGTNQGISFLFNNTHEAEVELGGIGPGTYDVVLYDFTQERSRLPQALTIVPSPLPKGAAMAVGMLGRLSKDDVGRVQPGLSLGDVGEVVAVGRAVDDMVRANAGGYSFDLPVESSLRVPVVVRMPCDVLQASGLPFCYVRGVPIQQSSVLTVQTAVGPLPFQVDQIRSAAPLQVARIVVRYDGMPQVASAVRPGDVDLGARLNELAAGARVVEVFRAAGGRVEVTLEVQIQDSSIGIVYGATPVRIGAPFYFRTMGYELQGVVSAIALPAPGGAAR